MQKVVIGLLISSSIVLGYGFDNNGKSGYKSDSGKRYQYDLNNQHDKLSYSTDTSAQQRDKYDNLYNNYDRHKQNDQRQGQYGGGIYDE
jgi:uncharacterized protein YlxW (UPF0749 family)